MPDVKREFMHFHGANTPGEPRLSWRKRASPVPQNPSGAPSLGFHHRRLLLLGFDTGKKKNVWLLSLNLKKHLISAPFLGGGLWDDPPPTEVARTTETLATRCPASPGVQAAGHSLRAPLNELCVFQQKAWLAATWKTRVVEAGVHSSYNCGLTVSRASLGETRCIPCRGQIRFISLHQSQGPWGGAPVGRGLGRRGPGEVAIALLWNIFVF